MGLYASGKDASTGNSARAPLSHPAAMYALSLMSEILVPIRIPAGVQAYGATPGDPAFRIEK